MPRTVSSTNETALAQTAIEARIMVDLDFLSGHVYAHDGVGALVYNGNTYEGLGRFASIEEVQESIEAIAKPVRLRLTGCDAATIALSRDEVYQNRQAIVMLGIVNASTGQLIDTPETIWEGRMDTMPISLGPRTGSITLNLEHRLRREPRVARYTDPDQQQAYSGDTFFEFVPAIAGFVSQWGNEKARYGTGGGSGPPRYYSKP